MTNATTVNCAWCREPTAYPYQMPGGDIVCEVCSPVDLAPLSDEARAARAPLPPAGLVDEENK